LKLSSLLEDADLAMLTKEQIDILRIRSGDDLRRSGCWDDPSNAMVRICSHARSALTGEVTDPGDDGPRR